MTHLLPKKQESVSVVMIPFDQYEIFPKAVDLLYEETRHPFQLIVVEGNSSELVRQTLEKKKQTKKNMKIIYTSHHPTMAQAYNLGLQQSRTAYTVFMHNNLLATPEWLSHLAKAALRRSGVVSPYVSTIGYANGKASNYLLSCRGTFHPLPESDLDLHTFWAPTAVLKEIGGFDESLGTAFQWIDLTLRLKQSGVAIARDPYTFVEFYPPKKIKSLETKLRHAQWNGFSLRENIAYIGQKYGITVDESKLAQWLHQRQNHSTLEGDLSHSYNKSYKNSIIPASSKINFPSFIRVLNKA